MPTPREKLEALGIEAVCDRLEGGESMRSIADSAGTSWGALAHWLESPEHSARAKDARRIAARRWDEMAEEELRTSPDVARARELAQHYRWRAKCQAPREYGDRQEQHHTGDGSAVIRVITGVPQPDSDIDSL